MIALMIEPDRSKWRYEDGGPAYEAAVRCVDLIRQPDVADRLEELRALVTEESWPNWRDGATAGFNIPWLNQLRGCLPKVRLPADGMAYVFCPIIHPDQTEPVTFDHQRILMHVVTLVEERGAWRVHQIGGEMVPPQDLGRQPYSW